MSILERARENYNKVCQYHIDTGYDAKLNVIWSDNMPDIARIVAGSGTAEDLIDAVDRTFMYSINFPPENGENTGVWKRDGDSPHIRERQMNWLLEKQKQSGVDVFSFPAEIQESQYIHHRNKTVRNGKTLSGNFLRTFSITQQIDRYVGLNKIKNIIELGGGCGHQARTFCLLIPDCKYTIVDLPETLFFSFTYISLNFPEKKILYVTSPEQMDTLDEYDFVFVPAVFSDRLNGRSYDLFINTASMGEMRNDVIHRWMDIIQNRINIKHLFTLNRYLNVVDDWHKQFRANENECSTSYDHKWDIINWELEPIYCRCPYIDTLHSRYVEIIATRPVERTDEERKTLSKEFYQSAIDEDWYRLKGYYGDGIMQSRSNVLANDLTMSGTLFKLWESIRMWPTKENVSAIIEYTNRLTVGHPFEEKFYYERILPGLSNYEVGT